MKIQAILTVNENGNWSINGWSGEKDLKEFKSISASCLDYDSDSRQVQYLVEFEVNPPDFQVLKVPEDKITVIKIKDEECSD